MKQFLLVIFASCFLFVSCSDSSSDPSNDGGYTVPANKYSTNAEKKIKKSRLQICNIVSPPERNLAADTIAWELAQQLNKEIIDSYTSKSINNRIYLQSSGFGSAEKAVQLFKDNEEEILRRTGYTKCYQEIFELLIPTGAVPQSIDPEEYSIRNMNNISSKALNPSQINSCGIGTIISDDYTDGSFNGFKARCIYVYAIYGYTN